MGLERVNQKVRRVVRPDGRVVDVQTDPQLKADAGKVLSLSPAVVELRSGDRVTVDAYLKTGVVPQVGSWVLVVTVGAFVLVLGEVVLL